MLKIENVSSHGHFGQLLMDSMMSVADTYFVPNRTVVLSLPLKIVSEDTIRHLLGNRDEANSIQFVNNLLENLHSKNKWPLLTSRSMEQLQEKDETDWDTSNDDKHSSYIVFVENFDEDHLNHTLLDIQQQIMTLESFSAWNPRGTFVVCLFTDRFGPQYMIKEILRLLFRWEIVNVIVMVPYYETDRFIVNVYTWFPYLLPSGSCGKILDVILIDTWILKLSGGQFLWNIPLFPKKVPNDLNGCPLSGTTFEFEPFVIFNEELGKGTNASIAGGLDIELMFCLTKAMNMDLNFKIPPGNFRGGSQLENGTWTGLRGDLIGGNADIAFASLLNGEDKTTFESTRIYFTDRFTWTVARAKPYPRWLAMIRVFAPSTWLYGFLSLIVGAIIMRTIFVFKIVQEKEVTPRYWGLVNCLTSVWAVFLEEGVASMPESLPLRMFFLCFVIYALAINTVFQAFFTSYIVNPGLLHQISDFDELLSADLVYTYYHYVMDKFLTDDFKQHLEPKVYCDPYDCFDVVATEYNCATFSGRVLVAYIIDFVVKKPGKHAIYPFPDDLFQLNSVMLVPKGSHLLNRFDEVITYIVEAGLPDQWMKNILTSRAMKAGLVALTDLSDEYEDLTMNHLQGAFMFLLMGIALASVLFIFELLTKSLCEKNNRAWKCKITTDSMCIPCRN
ncbi:Ionotropic receptor 223 [Blattella germanica]|nr:Ionotropic receptor 223 [Blattella germanica]